MPNRGNTGQHYKMSKFAKVEPYEINTLQGLLVTLSCGHSYVVIDGNPELFKRFIAQGKRTRCNDCS